MSGSLLGEMPPAIADINHSVDRGKLEKPGRTEA
jgi:hypothetical protein